jgi:hypothetical protein
MKARIGATSFFHAGTAQKELGSGSGSNSSPYPLSFLVKTNQIDLYRPRVGVRARTKALSFFIPELHQHDAAPVLAPVQTPIPWPI